MQQCLPFRLQQTGTCVSGVPGRSGASSAPNSSKSKAAVNARCNFMALFVVSLLGRRVPTAPHRAAHQCRLPKAQWLHRRRIGCRQLCRCFVLQFIQESPSKILRSQHVGSWKFR